jgi:hypothetical protein
VLPVVYGDIGAFGTGAMYVEEDMDDVLRFYPFPIGSYYISNNAKLKVDVFMRDFRMTVRQLIEKFAERDGDGKIKHFDNFSQSTIDAYKRGSLESWVDVVHVVHANDQFDEYKIDSKYKKFKSCYYEQSCRENENIYLSEKGYDYFPVLCPRWEVTGEDAYGTDCPGVVAIGDVKQLQLGEKRAAEGIERMLRPPMVASASLQNAGNTILPGGVTYLNEREGNVGFKPAYEVNPRLVELENKQQQVRQRIQRAFFEDLFLMLAQSDRRDITAREIDERHEEKLLALGPVLEQLNQDLLDPLIDITFAVMLERRMIPPAPAQLQGQPLRVEYVSIMAQAQKLVGISGIERFGRFVNEIVPISPDALDKVDTDKLIDEMGEALGIPPKIVRTDEATAAVRNQKQQAIRAQQAMQNIESGASVARNLSQANMEGDNELTRMIDNANSNSLIEGVS